MAEPRTKEEKIEVERQALLEEFKGLGLQAPDPAWEVVAKQIARLTERVAALEKV